jgi:acyl carrier protein
MVMKTHQEEDLVNRIRALFSRVLDCETVDVNVNKSFFEQGGTSLKVLKAVALLQQDISTQINIQLFLEHLSVAKLARVISNDQCRFPETTGDV